MNTPRLIGPALLLAAACPVAVRAQAAPPAAPALVPPTSAPASRAERLRLKFTVGQILYYSLTEDTVGSYLEPPGKLTRIKSHLEMHLHQTVADQRPADSAGLVDVGIDSMKVTVDGQPALPADGDLAAMTKLARLVVLPSGKLEETLVNPEVNAGEALAGEDPAHMNALAGVGELPDTPVKAGDTWKCPAFLGFLGEQATAAASLTGWETKDAASVAVIRQTLRGKFSTPAGDAAHPAGDTKIAGAEAATRTVRLNIEGGMVEEEDSLAYVVAVLTPKTGGGAAAVAPARMWAKVTARLTRTTKPPAPPPAAAAP